VIEVAMVLVRTRRLEEENPQALVRLLETCLERYGCRVQQAVEVAPDREAIAEQLAFFADRLHLPWIRTVGGTGLHHVRAGRGGHLVVVAVHPALGGLQRREVGALALERGDFLLRGAAHLAP